MLKHLKTYPPKDEYDVGFNVGVETAGRHFWGIVEDMVTRCPTLSEEDYATYYKVAAYDEERTTYLIEFEMRVKELLEITDKETS